VHIEAALERLPTCVGLSQLAKQSATCLRLITPLIPVGMRQSVQPGLLEDGCWCLLVPHSAAAAKLRQLIPAMIAHLRKHDQHVTELHIKVSMPSPK